MPASDRAIRIARVLVLGAVAGAAVAAGAGAIRPSVQPAGREVRLTLAEGTSMAVAPSPDGRRLAIDLLGAIWTLPAGGGRATRLLEDGYDARWPAWSPDGRTLAFQAYRDGTWDLWTLDATGGIPRQRTWGPFDDREPHWSPDGARLAFSSDRGGSYDIWILTLETGALARLTSHPANEFMPAWSPDGREIVFVSDRAEARGIYAQPVAGGSERLLRADARTLAAPAVSPDGALAYVAVDGADAQLVVGGANLADPGEDVFPFRPHWLPGGDLLYTANGGIRRRPAGGGPARAIPFAAEVAFTRPAFAPRARPLALDGPQPVLGLVHPAVSPDGTQVAFVALGDLWIAPVRAGEVLPARLTHDAFVEAYPAWSPDGARLAFSSDRDGSMDLWVRDLGDGRERKVASRAAAAAWSPDGTRLAFLDPQSRLHVVDAAGGEPREVYGPLFQPGRPSWAPDGRTLVVAALRPYSTRFREGTNQILRLEVPATEAAGGERAARWFDPVPHVSIGTRETHGPVWSPDGTHMAAIVDGHLAVFPVDPDGAPVGPLRRLSPDLAGTPSWTADARRILYQTAGRLRLVDVLDGRLLDIVPRLEWTPPAPPPRLTVHAGRLFDGRRLLEQVDIVIEEGRIARVEPHRADLHGAAVVDAAVGTVLPGLIESHTHLSKTYGEALGRIWLAFGVTTVRNPAANPFEALEDREAFDAGVRPGPRVLSTGEPFDGTRLYYPGGSALDGGAPLGERLAWAQALRFDFVKTYVRLPDLLQRRVIEEAHRLGMPVTSHEIYPAVAYGADGVEHIRGTSRRGFSPKMSELRRSYRDVVDLLAASGMTITPTIGIQGGHQLLTLRDGAWLDDPRIARLFPPDATAAARALRARAPDPRDLAAREALVGPQERFVRDVVRAGGRVIAGTDAPIIPYGLSLLMELEHYVRGGLTPAEAIRTATAAAAEAMGAADQIGTVEPGRIADLVIVDGNPLERITDLRRTRLVVKGGVVYDRDELLRPGALPGPR